MLKMSDVKPKEVSWLWPRRIPRGAITMIIGMPGVGKSFLTADMAARVTTGRPWPDGSQCPTGSVLLLTAEDDPSYTIRPRLGACGADVSRVAVLTGAYDTARPNAADRMIGLGDVDMLERAIQGMPDCRLIVVDPIGSYMGGKVDAHRENEVREVLAPIGQLAERTGAAVVMIAHRRKSSSSSADDLALGSRAFTGLARSVLHVTWEPKEEEGGGDAEDRRRLLLPGKINIAAPATGLAYTIGGEPAAISWAAEPVNMTADDAVAAENRIARGGGNSDDPGATKTAEQWVRHHLAEGPVTAKDIKRDALADGIKGRTLDRAAVDVGVVKKPAGVGQPWIWHLPGDERPYVPPPSLAKNPKSRQGLANGETGETGPEVGETEKLTNGRGTLFDPLDATLEDAEATVEEVL